MSAVVKQDTRDVAAKDIKEGDLVDLQGDRYADPKGEHTWLEFEFVRVLDVTHEGSECIAVAFDGFNVVGFPQSHNLKVANV